jgi:hypothetical protein
MWNFRMVTTRSFPIIILVCRPTEELNSIRYFFSSHCVSLSAGESMKDMLKEVNGCRFRVDQPFQMVVIFDEMCYLLVNTEESGKTTWLTSITSNVISSIISTFSLTAAAIHNLRGMSLSQTLGFMYVISSQKTDCSTKQNDYTTLLDLREKAVVSTHQIACCNKCKSVLLDASLHDQGDGWWFRGLLGITSNRR